MRALILVVPLLLACGENPFASGAWKNSSECGGMSEDTVQELWNIVEEDGFSLTAGAVSDEIDFVSEGDEVAFEGVPENTVPELRYTVPKLRCMAWLADNK